MLVIPNLHTNTTLTRHQRYEDNHCFASDSSPTTTVTKATRSTTTSTVNATVPLDEGLGAGVIGAIVGGTVITAVATAAGAMAVVSATTGTAVVVGAAAGAGAAAAAAGAAAVGAGAVAAGAGTAAATAAGAGAVAAGAGATAATAAGAGATAATAASAGATVASAGATVASAGATVASAGATVASAGATVASAGATVASAGATVASAGATVASAGATVASAGATVTGSATGGAATLAAVTGSAAGALVTTAAALLAKYGLKARSLNKTNILAPETPVQRMVSQEVLRVKHAPDMNFMEAVRHLAFLLSEQNLKFIMRKKSRAQEILEREIDRFTEDLDALTTIESHSPREEREVVVCTRSSRLSVSGEMVPSVTVVTAGVAMQMQQKSKASKKRLQPINQLDRGILVAKAANCLDWARDPARVAVHGAANVTTEQV